MTARNTALNRERLPLQQKRQIFREQVLPALGGKIPEEAFRTDRLALNRLNKEGITVPDGVVLDARHIHKHPHPDQRMPEIIKACLRICHVTGGITFVFIYQILRKYHYSSNYFIIVSFNFAYFIANDSLTPIKVYLTSDGRYVSPEGRPHYNYPKTVDTTYIIRRPFTHTNHRTPNNFESVKLRGYQKPQVYSNYKQFVPIIPPAKPGVYTPIVAPLVFPADRGLFDLSSWTEYEWDTVYEPFDDYFVNDLFDSHQVIS